MTLSALRFLSEAKLSELHRDVSANLHRYVNGDFIDLEKDNGWAIESVTVQVDLSMLAKLDGSERTAAADISNSLLVYGALKGMTPALACEERVWARLTHIECLPYSRARWLKGLESEDLVKAIRIHMLAPGRTGTRDDNAIARLWWNMHIAASADPDDPEGALRFLVKRADIRMQFVERPRTASRLPLARAIVRAMRSDPQITSTEEAFRRLMIGLNRDGGGILFEALGDAEADRLVERCAL